MMRGNGPGFKPVFGNRPAQRPARRFHSVAFFVGQVTAPARCRGNALYRSGRGEATWLAFKRRTLECGPPETFLLTNL
jgi:hypothetical protein